MNAAKCHALWLIFVAPVCFNTTYCEGESISDDLISFEQCCYESSGISYASPGYCFMCPRAGILKFK